MVTAAFEHSVLARIITEVGFVCEVHSLIICRVYLCPSEPRQARLESNAQDEHVEKDPNNREHIAWPKGEPRRFIIPIALEPRQADADKLYREGTENVDVGDGEVGLPRDPVIDEELPHQRAREKRRLTLQPVLVIVQGDPLARKGREGRETKQHHHIHHEVRGFSLDSNDRLEGAAIRMSVLVPLLCEVFDLHELPLDLSDVALEVSIAPFRVFCNIETTPLPKKL